MQNRVEQLKAYFAFVEDVLGEKINPTRKKHLIEAVSLEKEESESHEIDKPNH
jgi:hypothetical protein